MICKDQAISVTQLDDYCTRSLMVHNTDLMMVRFDFKKGGVGQPHSHENHTQVGYILSGRFELTCGETTTIVKAGDSYLVDENVMHGVVALEDGAILDVFTPCRDEFK